MDLYQIIVYVSYYPSIHIALSRYNFSFTFQAIVISHMVMQLVHMSYDVVSPILVTSLLLHYFVIALPNIILVLYHIAMAKQMADF